MAQLAGAAAAATVIPIAAERFSLDRGKAALGGAAVAFAASRATTGTARALFEGAMLAGIGLGVAELVRSFRESSAQAAATPRATVPAAGGITRREFEEQLETLRTQLADQQKERERLHREQVEELVRTVHDLRGQLRAAHEELQRLRLASSQRKRGGDFRRIEDRPGVTGHPFPSAMNVAGQRNEATTIAPEATEQRRQLIPTRSRTSARALAEEDELWGGAPATIRKRRESQ